MSEVPTSSDWANERGKKWVENMAATEAMLVPIDEPLIAAVQLTDALRVAEIGCGGGRTTHALAQHLPAGGEVHGIDISADVVAAANAAKSLPNVCFHCLDAGRDALPAANYDRLCSRFGVMFFEEPESAFAHLANSLSDDGRFAFAVWGPLADNPWMTSLRDAMAGELELPRPEPDAPGPFRYADADGFAKLLSDCGFADISVRPWHGELPIGGSVDAECAADFALSAFSIGEMAAGDEALLGRVHNALRKLFRLHERNGSVHMLGAVNIFTGGRC